jgi:hypothetical protein
LKGVLFGLDALNLQLLDTLIKLCMTTAYHTNEHRGDLIIVYAQGFHQWLGDAYYFWQDIEFAEEWATNARNGYPAADIYEVELDLNFDTDEFVIDTVFNEEHYYKFIEKIERFSDVYFAKFNQKPSIEDFNSFIFDLKIPLWKDIKAIRFQDLPNNDKKNYLKVKGFFYKKRIQIALFDAKRLIKYNIIQTVENPKFKNG